MLQLILHDLNIFPIQVRGFNLLLFAILSSRSQSCGKLDTMMRKPCFFLFFSCSYSGFGCVSDMANAAVPCGMGLRKISDESEVVAGIHVCSDIHVRASTRGKSQGGEDKK